MRSRRASEFCCARLRLLTCLVLLAWSAVAAAGGEDCPKPQAATFGILLGGVASPLKLRPLELARAEALHALPLANPVLTPWQLDGVAAVADPVVVPHPDDPQHLTMLFAALPCASATRRAPARWGVAAAVSDSGGAAWRPLGWVLRDAGRDLRAPSVFHHVDNWFMAAEVQGEGVRLYKAEEESFPAGWKFSRVLTEAPLQGVSIVRHNHTWWMIGSRPGAGLGGQQQVLSIQRARSPLGPWEPHLSGSFAAAAATTMGPAFVWKGSLHRLGRACRAGAACGPVEVVQMSISEEAFEQATLPLDLGRPLWRQQSRWDGAGWSQLSIARRIDGSWIAVMAASALLPEPPALPARLERAVVAFKGLALLSIVALLATGASRAAPGLRASAARRAGLPGRPLRLPSHKHDKAEDDWPVGGCLADDPAVGLRRAAAHPLAIKLVVHGTPDSDARSIASVASSGPASGASSGSSSPSKLRAAAARARGAGGYRRALMEGVRAKWAGSRPSSAGSSRSSSPPRRLAHARWPAALAAAALALALAGVWGARWVERVAEPFSQQAQAIAVDGQYSRFTLMVMSYGRRLRELQWYVRHYSQCPSVGEILVVWNRGAPPDPRAHLQSAVPVRVRVEATNSMNNRFRPDPHLKFRSVLSLDDDILLPCATVEEAFAEWRAAPQRLLGFYPRLLRPAEPGGPPVYQFEQYVFQQRAYNAILAGGAFMDAATFFPLYFSEAAAPGRALVDAVFNCDDLLFNFVVANWTRGVQAEQAAAAAAGADAAPPLPPPVQLVRPRRRLDLSRLSGVGISHSPARFKAAADRCLAEFSALFGGSPLVEQAVPGSFGAAPTCAWPFDCMYLADPAGA